MYIRITVFAVTLVFEISIGVYVPEVIKNENLDIITTTGFIYDRNIHSVYYTALLHMPMPLQITLFGTGTWCSELATDSGL